MTQPLLILSPQGRGEGTVRWRTRPEKGSTQLVNRGLLDQWYAVAKSVQVKPGKPQAVKALGRNLVLWRDGGGSLKCLEDYCPHRGARFSRGEVSATTSPAAITA